MIARFLFFCALLILSAQTVNAHTRSQSFSDWKIEGHSTQVMIAVDARRITQLATLYPERTEITDLYHQHVRETVSVLQEREECALSNLSPVGEGRDVFRVNVTFTCEQPILATETQARIGMFFKVSPTHIHLARIAGNDAEGVQGHDFVLREGQISFVLAQTRAPQSIWGFISIGFHHVLSGLDHMVFLVALAMVARRPRLAVFCVTGFTLGHTTALGLSTYGLIVPDVRMVEALIGFTIAVMAMEAGTVIGLSYQAHPPIKENAKKQARGFMFSGLAVLALLVCVVPVGYNPTVLGIGVLLAVYCLATGLTPIKTALAALPFITVAFGLVHGAGFAGGLQELSLSQVDIFLPLLGFNIGVELAQLLALAGVYGIGWVLNRSRLEIFTYAQHITALFIFGMGLYWFAVRVWG